MSSHAKDLNVHSNNMHLANKFKMRKGTLLKSDKPQVFYLVLSDVIVDSFGSYVELINDVGEYKVKYFRMKNGSIIMPDYIITVIANQNKELAGEKGV